MTNPENVGGRVEGRGVAGEISGTLAERERQLRDLFCLAAAALGHSLRLDQLEVPRPQCCGQPDYRCQG